MGCCGWFADEWSSEQVHKAILILACVFKAINWHGRFKGVALSNDNAISLYFLNMILN
jgi:hypothetical protein